MRGGCHTCMRMSFQYINADRNRKRTKPRIKAQKQQQQQKQKQKQKTVAYVMASKVTEKSGVLVFFGGLCLASVGLAQKSTTEVHTRHRHTRTTEVGKFPRHTTTTHIRDVASYRSNRRQAKPRTNPAAAAPPTSLPPIHAPHQALASKKAGSALQQRRPTALFRRQLLQ